jgi:hypothetical protein
MTCQDGLALKSYANYQLLPAKLQIFLRTAASVLRHYRASSNRALSILSQEAQP